jgi:hypothetical protein
MDCETFAAEHLAPLYGEPAAPLVLRLMLAQEELHPKLAPVWSGWAWFLREGCPSRRLLAAEESVLKEWEDQLALARRAREAASPEGAKRLDVIAQVLDEYLRIGRFSRTGAAAAMIQDQERLRNNPAEAAAASGQLVADLELPGEIYGPRQGSGQDSG